MYQLEKNVSIRSRKVQPIRAIAGKTLTERLLGALQASGVATLSILKERKETAYPWLEATNRRIAESINSFCEAEVRSRLPERSLYVVFDVDNLCCH